MLVLQVDGIKPLTANDARRMEWRRHRAAIATLKQHLDAAGCQLHGRRGWPHVTGPHIATLQVQPRDRGHRDTDGWAPTLKAALDVIVARGVLDDDCTNLLPEVRIVALPPGDRWVISLHLEPLLEGAEPQSNRCSSSSVMKVMR